MLSRHQSFKWLSDSSDEGLQALPSKYIFLLQSLSAFCFPGNTQSLIYIFGPAMSELVCVQYIVHTVHCGWDYRYDSPERWSVWCTGRLWWPGNWPRCQWVPESCTSTTFSLVLPVDSPLLKTRKNMNINSSTIHFNTINGNIYKQLVWR